MRTLPAGPDASGVGFCEPETGIFAEAAFRTLLAREAARATRYQDFFSLCVVRADTLGASGTEPEALHRVVSRSIAGLVRATDMIGRLHDAIGIVLLHTEGEDAARVAERIRAGIEQVAFPPTGSDRGGLVTLSMGGVSFPQDGHNDALLLTRAAARLHEARRRGGNQVVYASEARGPASDRRGLSSP